jgi:hypothetical protein
MPPKAPKPFKYQSIAPDRRRSDLARIQFEDACAADLVHQLQAAATAVKARHADELAAREGTR